MSSLFLRRHKSGRTENSEGDSQMEDDMIDPELRLRTVRTAHSVLAESVRSEARAKKRKALRAKTSKFFHRGEKKAHQEEEVTTTSSFPSDHVSGSRRNVYVNAPLRSDEVDGNGEPLQRYVRNKVKSSKYTALTFIPKNLFLQFQRIANLYFLALVIFQLFPIFGAASAYTASLPLIFILVVTAIKDGVEDYRRAALDDEVNNSAATKLGNWRNVNSPSDPRTLFERIFNLNPPGRVTRGVRKLREKDANEGMRIVLSKTGDNRVTSRANSSLSETIKAGSGLSDIASVNTHNYPPNRSASTFSLLPNESGTGIDMKPYEQAEQSRSTLGVVDWSKPGSGATRWERTLWKKLEVGDIVLLRENDQVPADIVVLSTSDPDGMCYLETKNLDGETNLKPRKAVHATSSITCEDDVEHASFVLDSEPPHQNLYLYHGVIRYKDVSTAEIKQEAVGINEFLLRGCALRNTAWVIGLVVFTGADTKIVLNGGLTPQKRSKIEVETNFNVIVNFGVLVIMCSIAAVLSGILDNQGDNTRNLFESGPWGSSDPTSSSIANSLVTFVSCLIAFQNIVPISLFISIEIVKTIQAYFIAQDLDLYYDVLDAPCVPKTWNISDDLGQIEYIFSDKTGTLTQNIMEFQKCSVQGVMYGEGITEAQRGAATRQGITDILQPDALNDKLASLKAEMLGTMKQSYKNRYRQDAKLTFVSPKIALDLTDRSSAQRTNLIAFFRALAICHGVLADKPDAENPNILEYKAESPDEAALVALARDLGFPFTGKTRQWIDIEVMGQPERWEPLKTLEFNSTRKRMSVIVRSPEGRIIMYTKGADSVIYERLAPDHDITLKAQTEKDMETFANNGLRTLCIAYRYISDDEYLSWSQTYDAATNTINDRDAEIDKANALIEHSLTILGATALEDKLQAGVPEAIETLHQAGIKLWILTGDKLQTAIEIGYSCNLLKNDMDIMILSADSPATARMQIEAGLNKIASILGPPLFDPRKRGFLPGDKASFAVVIDGDTLTHALTPELKGIFLDLGTQCETVVCCRVSPAQKALTVKLVKDGRNAMTLSIGDGANDVAMIQEANIGCGLLGLEGAQAAMSADYAFGQFRFLTKLLLVHGRWSYQRIADMHSNFFYKNVIWTFAMFWFLPFDSFDGTYLFNFTFILLYNVVFTSLPVTSLGAFDQDINAKAALAFPQLYVRGIRGLEYTRTKFWLYMFDGLYQSAVVFFFAYVSWQTSVIMAWNGRGIGSLADFGTTISVSAIFCANTFVGLNTNYWTFITWIVVFGSSIVMLLWIVVYSFFPGSDLTQEVVILFSEVVFWVTVLISVTVALAPRFLFNFISATYYPLDKEIVRESWVAGDLKDRLGISHRNLRKIRINVPDSPESFAAGPETAPMFHSPHARSESEMSAQQQHGSPDHQHTGQSLDIERGFVLTRPSIDTQVTSEPSHIIGAATPGSPPSPQPSQFSRYSASDIPIPSPLPEPEYRYTTGEPTTSRPPNRANSVASRYNNNNLHPFASPPPVLPSQMELSDMRRSSALDADWWDVSEPEVSAPRHSGHDRTASGASYQGPRAI